MIKINNTEYQKYETKITWGKYEIYKNKIRKNGIAPFINFNIENKIFIGLEFVYDEKDFKNLNLNEKTNITEYISDILYNDKKGWMPLGKEENNTCTITKTNDKDYILEFSIESDEIEEITININTKIQLF